jgi:metal-responsive CopG/Arc/MetJ family transcriptional regulator
MTLLSVSVPADVIRQLDERARREDRSRSHVARMILVQELKEEEEPRG